MPATWEGVLSAGALACGMVGVVVGVWAGTRVWRARREHVLVAAKARAVSQRLRLLRVRVREDEAARIAHLEGLLRLRTSAPRDAPSRDLLDREARFAATSAGYSAAAAAWSRGDVPEGTRRTSIAGVHWSLPPDESDPGSLSHRILERGWLPLEHIEAVRSLANGGVMLDIGANIGTTVIPRLLLEDFAFAYAAEPHSDNYRCLVGNVIENGLTGIVLPDRVAISSSNGTARLRRAAHIGGHQLMGADARPLDSEEVTCLTLDTWLARLAVAPATVRFVKVDTQGWDLHVLQGATDLLQSRQVVWQIEVSASMMKGAGSDVAELCALVQARFTHVKVLGMPDGPAFMPASSIAELLATPAAGRRFADLVLFNLA